MRCRSAAEEEGTVAEEADHRSAVVVAEEAETALRPAWADQAWVEAGWAWDLWVEGEIEEAFEDEVSTYLFSGPIES